MGADSENEKNQQDIQERYVDSMQIQTSLYTAVLTFGDQRTPGPPIDHIRLRVSPQMLKAISMLTSKHVRDYESNIGHIAIPNELAHDWGLEEEIT